MHCLRTRAASAFLVVLAAVACLFAGGCTFSETITQTVYEQNPANQMDDSQRLLVNTLAAKKTSAELPKLENDQNAKEKDDTDENLPRYGGNTSDALVAKPVESPKRKRQKARARQQRQVDGDKTTDEAGEKTTSSKGEGASGSRGSDADDKDGRGEKKGKKGRNPSEGGGRDKAANGKGKNAGNDIKVYEDYGEFPEIPKNVKHVTAVGQAAVIVSMLGGSENSSPLVGADEDLLEDSTAQKFLKNKGLSKAKKIWKHDGSSEGDLADVKDIVKLDPELCFVTEGEKTLSSKQRATLLKNRIIVYVLPDMKSAAKIKYAVKLVGDILEAGGNEQAGTLAKEYREFHDDLVKKISDKNKGLAGGFNYDTGKKTSSDAKARYSLYISDWDYGASYDDPNEYIKTSQGIGVADLGYEEAPVSYYLSVGGVVNNAAAGTFRSLSGQSAAVWQFSLTQAPCAWTDWKSIDRGKVTYALKGDGFSGSLLWANEAEAGLGRSEFPGVVVANRKMKKAMEADEENSHGAYYPYPATSISRGGTIRLKMVGFSTGSSHVASCIGTWGSAAKSSLNDGSKVEKYQVLVNPSTSFSDWAAGSVESVLEAPWAYKAFCDDSYDAASDVRAFYHDFYGYDLDSDELDDILDGRES